MELTYLDLINGFNNWCEDNYLDIKSQIIFFKILHLMNRSGWKEWTQISNMRLMDFCGIESDKSFIRLRDKLIEVGFIEYQKGKKSQPNKYKLCTGNFEKVKQKYTVKYTGKKESTNDSINDSTSVPHNKKEEKELRVKKDISKDISKEKHAYGSAKNVLLTDKQHTKLQQDYGSDLLEMVEYLSDYIAKKGGEIEKQDHNRVLRGWVKNAVRERKLKQQELELREKELEARKKRLEMGYPYPKHGANQGVKPDVEDKSTDINDWISKGAQNMKNAVLSLIDNTIRNAENYANFSNRDYKNSQGLLMCGNCHTPKQKFLDIDKSSSLYERYKGHPVPVVCQCRKEL